MKHNNKKKEIYDAHTVMNRILHGPGGPRAGPENLRLKMGREGPHPQRAGPPWNGPPFIYARTVLELAELIRNGQIMYVLILSSSVWLETYKAKYTVFQKK